LQNGEAVYDDVKHCGAGDGSNFRQRQVFPDAHHALKTREQLPCRTQDG